MNLIDYIRRHREWSFKTFGPGDKTAGVLAHIRKELKEIEANPADVYEWVDVIILAIDGAWRNGHSADDIVRALEHKQLTNDNRQWPDWRTVKTGEPIEHIKDQPI